MATSLCDNNQRDVRVKSGSCSGGLKPEHIQVCHRDEAVGGGLEPP